MYRPSVTIVVENTTGADADIFAVREITEQEYIEITTGYADVGPAGIMELRPATDADVLETVELLTSGKPLAVYVDGVRRCTLRCAGYRVANQPGRTPSVVLQLRGNSASAMASHPPMGWSMTGASLAQVVDALLQPWGITVTLGEAASLAYSRRRTAPPTDQPTPSEAQLRDAASAAYTRVNQLAVVAARRGWNEESMRVWTRASEAAARASAALNRYLAGATGAGTGTASTSPDGVARNLAGTVEPRQMLPAPDEKIGDFLTRLASRAGLVLHEDPWGNLAMVVPDFEIRNDRPIVHSVQPGAEQPVWDEGLILASELSRKMDGPTVIEARSRVGKQQDQTVVSYQAFDSDDAGRYQYERLQRTSTRDGTDLARATEIAMANVRFKAWSYSNTICGFGYGPAALCPGQVVRVEDHIVGVHEDLYAYTVRVRFGDGQAPVQDVVYVRPETWVIGEAIREVFSDAQGGP